MITFEPGEIITVPFPFSDLSGIKKRPALVLAVFDRQQELICMMLTSMPARSQLEYVIQDWKSSGLIKPTTAKIHRIFTIAYTTVNGRLGRLNQKEHNIILNNLLGLLRKGS